MVWELVALRSWFGQGRRPSSLTEELMSWQRSSSHQLLSAAIAQGAFSLQCLTLLPGSNHTDPLSAEVLLCWQSFLTGTGAPCELSGQPGAGSSSCAWELSWVLPWRQNDAASLRAVEETGERNTMCHGISLLLCYRRFIFANPS